ncbi:hypothetical protein [Trichothermofontia sp.]
MPSYQLIPLRRSPWAEIVAIAVLTAGTHNLGRFTGIAHFRQTLGDNPPLPELPIP